jgi:hypothetical protein
MAARNQLDLAGALRVSSGAREPLEDSLKKVGADLSRELPRLLRERGSSAESIAVHSALHALDAFAYLGRALLAHMLADNARAVHLGYYSELHAACSILAADGLLVGNGGGKTLGNDGVVRSFCPPRGREGTHQIAWSLLEAIGQRPLPEPRFLGVLMVGGYPLSDWMEALSISAEVGTLVGGQLLGRCGLDLKAFRGDRESRNMASYRPIGAIGDVQPWECGPTVSFVRACWLALEPSRGTGADRLGSLVLRQLIERSLRAVGRTKPGERVPEELAFNVVRQLGIDEGLQRPLANFLSRRTLRKDPDPVRAAAGNSAFGSAQQPRELLSRALLLTWLAGQTVRSLLLRSRVSVEQLEFLTSVIGAHRGLWPIEQPDDFADLWQEIESALERLDQASTLTSQHEFLRTAAPELLELTRTERAFLWEIPA